MDLDPPLHVGRLRESVPRPDRTGLKEQLLRGLWLTQAGRRERYGGGGAEAGRACGVRGVVTLQEPEARRAFSRGSCPQITGPWPWRAAPAPGSGGVESDLGSHTGFLVAAAAALASHARLWSLC